MFTKRKILHLKMLNLTQTYVIRSCDIRNDPEKVIPIETFTQNLMDQCMILTNVFVNRSLSVCITILLRKSTDLCNDLKKMVVYSQ